MRYISFIDQAVKLYKFSPVLEAIDYTKKGIDK